jgi:hypothetical protein
MISSINCVNDFGEDSYILTPFDNRNHKDHEAAGAGQTGEYGEQSGD